MIHQHLDQWQLFAAANPRSVCPTNYLTATSSQRAEIANSSTAVAVRVSFCLASDKLITNSKIQVTTFLMRVLARLQEYVKV